MRKTLSALAGIGMLVGVVSTAFAANPPACSPSNSFDTFTLGSVNGQDGWSATGPYDQAIVSNTYGYSTFGCKSLRMSDSVTSGSFGDQVFAKPLIDSAGETAATAGTFSVGVKRTHFEMQFDIASTMQTPQLGMHTSVSPDRGDGSRMSYLRFEDSALGLNVFFDDVQQTSACTPSGCANFVETQVGTNLSRSVPHTIKLTMDFVDGPSNDVVKVYIDGALVHTGTSWEDYYRFDPEASAEQSPRIVKTVLFRESGAANPLDAGNGFLFDKFSISATSRPTNADQCRNGGWQQFNNPVFTNQGQCISFVNNHSNDNNDHGDNDHGNNDHGNNDHGNNDHGNNDHGDHP